MSVASKHWLWSLPLCVTLLLACGDDALPPAEDFESQGPYLAEPVSITIDPPAGDTDPIDAMVWMPGREADQAPIDGFPLVAFVAAAPGGVEVYQKLLGHLASHGFAIVGITMGGRGDDAQRQASRLWAAIESTLQGAEPGSLDPTRLAVAGHSTGARIALLAASMDHDRHDAILAAVAWDPIDFNTSNDPAPVSVTPEHMATMDAPALIFGTPESACVIAGDDHDDFYAAAKSPALHLYLPTADHLDWVDDYGEGAYGFSIANML